MTSVIAVVGANTNPDSYRGCRDAGSTVNIALAHVVMAVRIRQVGRT